MIRLQEEMFGFISDLLKKKSNRSMASPDRPASHMAPMIALQVSMAKWGFIVRPVRSLKFFLRRAR